jgi:hypothetical protein
MRSEPLANPPQKHSALLELLSSPYFVFAVAMCVRLAIIFLTKSYREVEHTEIIRVATSLAKHGTFADAFGKQTGATAHVAPLYPILLSFIFRLFGTGVAGEITQEIFSSAIASLTYAGLPLLSAAIGCDPLLGGIAGLAGGILPMNFWSESKGSFEAALAGFFLMLFCLAICRLWRSQVFSVASAVTIGLISGLALLTSPSLAPIIGTVLLAGFVLFGSKPGNRYGSFFLVASLCTVASLCPWAIRNRLALGGFVWSRSGLGLEFDISNNDIAAANWLDNIDSGWFQKSHPYFSAEERSKVIAMGELAYNREKMAEAKSWIASHPTHFLKLCLERAYYFWFPRMKRPVQRALMAVFAIGGLIGLGRLFRDRNRAAWIFLCVLTAYPLVYYLVESFARYRCPIDWLLIFLSVLAVWSFVVGPSRSAESVQATELPLQSLNR